MKRFLTYCLWMAALLLGAAAASVPLWEDGRAVAPHTECASSDASLPLRQSGFSPLYDHACLPAELTRASGPHLSTPAARTQAGIHHTPSAHHAHLTLLQLHSTESEYATFYSGKERTGYYLYALRKLLI